MAKRSKRNPRRRGGYVARSNGNELVMVLGVAAAAFALWYLGRQPAQAAPFAGGAVAIPGSPSYYAPGDLSQLYL